MSDLLMLEKWKTQIRKGYLELCILSTISQRGRTYGFDLLEGLNQSGLDLKEGTLYPILNRMTSEGILKSEWETRAQGHPRKFYSLSKNGEAVLTQMVEDFESMIRLFRKLKP